MGSAVARGAGHGKAILAGEHFVLDGATAVAIPLPAFRTEVTLRATAGTCRVTLAPAPGAGLSQTDRLQAEAMLGRALRLVGFGGAVAAAVSSTVPLRRGFGSSAAFSVAAVQAAWRLTGAGEPPAAIWLEQARSIEALVHGTSSGLDPATAMGRGAVVFRHGALQSTIPDSSDAAWRRARWVLMDLGPGPATSAVIQRANRARGRMTEAALALLVARANAAALAAVAGLAAGDLMAVANAMAEAGTCLATLDVVNETMATCITAAVAGGALAAKQTGAGMGGALLALAPDAESADTVCRHVAGLAATTWIVETTA